MRMTNFRLQNSADVEGFEPEDDLEESICLTNVLGKVNCILDNFIARLNLVKRLNDAG